MGRIKGWEKTRNEKGLIIWENNMSNSVVLINDNIRISNGEDTDEVFWSVVVGKIFTRETFEFKTKTEAQKFAIKWMRKHPRG